MKRIERRAVPETPGESCDFNRRCNCDKIWMAINFLCFSSNDFSMGDNMAREYSFIFRGTVPESSQIELYSDT